MKNNIIIVGSGLAGLVAGIEGCKYGYNVTILEKMKSFGGNSIKASSGINLIDSKLQKEMGIQDDADVFMQDSLNNCDQNPNLLNQLCIYSSKVEEFWEKIGVTFDDIVLCGGHSVVRTHRSKQHIGIGYYLVKNAYDIFIKLGGTILYNTQVTELVTDEYQVIGVKTMDHTIYNGIIILATGGYERSLKYLVKSVCLPGLNVCMLPTTAGNHCTGDGLDLGTSLGANLVGMNHVQFHPTGIVDEGDPYTKTKFLAPEILRGVGGLLYNMDNIRLGHELDTRDKVTDTIVKGTTNNIAKLVLDKKATNKIPNIIEFYSKKGLCKTDNGLTTFLVTPVIHYTMGGLQINGFGQVIHRVGSIIPNLYAIGEVTGGIHGKNRLAGNSLLECCVYGIKCVEYIHSKKIEKVNKSL